MKRRDLLLSGGAALAGAGLSLGVLSNRAAANPLQLAIQPARYNFGAGETTGLVSLSPDGPPPVIRMRQNQPFEVDLLNTLPDYTAMHWHGLRIPNEMDGVPYLTQFPIAGGESYRYAYTPPDAGTYWYHPHCMTMDQMARGLTGLLVVEEEEDQGFSSEEILNLKDFRLGDDGQFIEIFTPRGAARSGSFGSVVTANWQQDVLSEHPTGGITRLRLAATDTARIYRIYIPGAEGRVIAWDGHPLLAPIPLPVSEASALNLSPGQRVDIALKLPETEGQELEVMADIPGGPRRMARLRATGPNQARDLAEIAPLPANPAPLPDLQNIDQVEEFVFGWSPDGDLPDNGFCGTLGYTFWSINRTPWAGDAAQGVGPLATLRQGRTHVLRLRNESPNDHPIHLHGLAFVPIRSNRREIAPNLTDTALLFREETIDVALVADNPGDWAFHCHVIEHQKTGLAGYIRVA